MKRLIVFDLDGTIAESKSSLDDEMSVLLRNLLSIVKVAVISGGNWPQFEKQLVSNLPRDANLENLSLLPTCGTKFYKYGSTWQELYSENFADEEKAKIIASLHEATGSLSFGDPAGVERLGVALESEMDKELQLDGTGGCEDLRITFVEPIRRCVMTHTPHSPNGPRIALAISEDLFRWQRLGLAFFRPYEGIDVEGVDNTDASVIPVAIPDPSGQLSMAILQRPLFPGTRPEETSHYPASGLVDLHRESIWISYCSTALADCEPLHLCHFGSHLRLAAPEAAWEQFKLGGGTPPILASLTSPRKLCYSAGALVLSEELPQVIHFRLREPVLIPELPQEREGIVANVLFPTSIDRRDDLGSPDRFDVYYGMADNRIGLARLDVSKHLPSDKEVER